MDLLGQQFGRLTVISTWGVRHSRVRCACGVVKVIQNSNLLYGGTVSCGCYRTEIHRRAEDVKRFGVMWRAYRQRCRIDRLTFALSRKEFLATIRKRCWYCGAAGNPFNGIDRLDNSKGYTRGNSKPCCETCNRAKLCMTQKEFLQWVKRVYLHRVN